MQVRVGDLVKNTWQSSAWYGLVLEARDDEILVWRPELRPYSHFLWWQLEHGTLEGVGEGR